MSCGLPASAIASNTVAGILGMAEHFVAQLAGIAGPRDDNGSAVEIADAADGEAEPLQLGDAGLRRRRPHHLLQDLAARRALDREVVQLVGRGAHPRPQAELLPQLAQHEAARLVAADEAEVVLAQAEDRAVVEHAAGLVAHGGIDHLPFRQLAHVARHRALQQRLGIGPGHLELAQGREVDHHRALSGRPVFADRPFVVEAARQPVAAILREVARERGEARMERGFLGHLSLCIGSPAEGHRAREALLGRIGADVDRRRVPAVGGVDVVRAGRRHAHQVGQRAEQHEVAGPRPRLVEIEHVVVVDRRCCRRD